MTNNPYTGKARYDAWNKGYEAKAGDANPYTPDTARWKAFALGQDDRFFDNNRPATPEKA